MPDLPTPDPIVATQPVVTVPSLPPEMPRIGTDLEAPTDLEIVSYIDSLSDAELNCFSCCHPTNLKHYNNIQGIWLRTAQYYAAQKLGDRPSEIVFVDDLKCRHTLERFRAFYSLRFPDAVYYQG